MLDLEGVTKRYGRAAALREVNLHLDPGSTVFLAGPNGAGKSTLLRLAATLEAPTLGRVRVAGHDARRDGAKARAALQYAGHEPALYGDLTAAENLRFFGGFHLPRGALESRVAEMLEAVDLTDRADTFAGGFSRGMQQRLALARALLPDARLLLLDEPFTGLDPASETRVTRLLREWRRPDRTLLFTTHDIETGLALADTVVLLRGGRLDHRGPARDFTAARLREALGVMR